MRVGLVVYGSIETLTGGYLYDRRLLDHFVSRGDRAEVISLSRRNHYPRALCDNASPSLVRRLTRARFDVLLQDELVHPSLVFLNGWLIARAGLATHVHLVGTVPNARIPEYLITSHLLLVPSHYEALGIAYLEAMRVGLPVIATTAGGAHEIVGHGREASSWRQATPMP
jgi:hypothetical protein